MLLCEFQMPKKSIPTVSEASMLALKLVASADLNLAPVTLYTTEFQE